MKLKLKSLTYLLPALFIVSCSNEKNTTPTSKSKEVDVTTNDTLAFPFISNIRHPIISNNSDRQIDVLFNGVNNYLGGKANSNVHFTSECLSCESIQEYKGELLFAKRLLISANQITYFKNNLDIPDNAKPLEFHFEKSEKSNLKFKFNDGIGSIRYIGNSCNDASFNKVSLTYSTGQIVVDSLINASFFEYDLNKDGQQEQYLLGTRNCSQEVIILRIRKVKEKFSH